MEKGLCMCASCFVLYVAAFYFAISYMGGKTTDLNTTRCVYPVSVARLWRRAFACVPPALFFMWRLAI